MQVRIEFRQSASTDFQARLLARILVSSAFRVGESSISVNRGEGGGTIRLEFSTHLEGRECDEATDALYAARNLPEFGEGLIIQCLGFNSNSLSAVVSYGGGDRSIYSSLLDLFAVALDSDDHDPDSDFVQLCDAFPAVVSFWEEYCTADDYLAAE